MFDWISDLSKRIADALKPIKNFDEKPLMQIVRNPIETKKLMDKKQAAIILLDETRGIDIVGGLKYSNVVLNPSLGHGGMGWITSEKTSWLFKKKVTAYLCHPKIPFALAIGDDAFHSVTQITEDMKIKLGLPKDMAQLLPETLASLVINKWQTGFDERSGNTMIFIFGFVTGGVILTILIFILLAILGFAVSR